MPAISYSDVEANVVPVPAWRFWLTFPDIPGTQQAGQTLPFLAQRVMGSQKAIETEPIVFGAHIRHFPIGYSIENLSIMLVEDIDFTVVRAIRAWMNLVIDDNDNFGLPGGQNGYKKPFSLESLDVDGTKLVTFKWKDCMPTRLDGYEWDGTQTGMLTPTLTMSVDTMEIPSQ